METIKAKMVEIEEKHFLQIGSEGEEIKIPISEDKPNAVKSAFNKLIKRIKEGGFTIKMEEVGHDLFSQVASEYIAQLNREINEVRKEMEQFGLVDSEDGVPPKG